MDGAWRRPTDSSLRSGTPSLSEVPSGGARAFCLLLRFSKVSRRQSGTLSGRYLNGYVHNPTVLTARQPSRASPLPQFDCGCQGDRCRLAGRHRRQASSHIWITGRQGDRCRLSGRHRRQASSHRLIVGCQVDRCRLGGCHSRQASSTIGSRRTRKMNTAAYALSAFLG